MVRVGPQPRPYPYWPFLSVSPDGLNSGFYSNPRADDWMEQRAAKWIPEKRVALYHRLHRLPGLRPRGLRRQHLAKYAFSASASAAS